MLRNGKQKQNMTRLLLCRCHLPFTFISIGYVAKSDADVFNWKQLHSGTYYFFFFVNVAEKMTMNLNFLLIISNMWHVLPILFFHSNHTALIWIDSSFFISKSSDYICIKGTDAWIKVLHKKKLLNIYNVYKLHASHKDDQLFINFPCQRREKTNTTQCRVSRQRR